MASQSGSKGCSESREDHRCIGWTRELLRDAPLRARIYCKVKLAEAGMVDEFETALDTYAYDEHSDRILGEYGEWKVKLDSAESRVRLRELGVRGSRLQPVMANFQSSICSHCGYGDQRDEDHRVICSLCYYTSIREFSEERRRELLDKDTRDDPDAGEVCDAVLYGRRDCKGASDCDGSCWHPSLNDRKRRKITTRI